MNEIIDKLRFLKSLLKISSFIFKFIYQVTMLLEIKKNRSLKNKFEGETCYIIGNGVSVENLDVEFLNKQKVFTCNHIFYHKHFNELKIDFYTMIEPYYSKIMGKSYYDDAINLYKDIDSNFNKKNSILFFHPSLRNVFKKNNFFINNECYFVNSYSIEKPVEKLSNDLAGRFNFGNGALSFMIATSIYMGFKKIVLMGCGYTYDPRQEFHFYARPKFLKENINLEEMMSNIEQFRVSNNLKLKRILETKTEYIPEFVSSFNKDKTFHLYDKLFLFAESKNVEILNIHPEGYTSPIFNGTTWDSYISCFTNKF